MDTLNIALLQIAPGAALEENLEKGLAACKRAKEIGRASCRERVSLAV